MNLSPLTIDKKRHIIDRDESMTIALCGAKWIDEPNRLYGEPCEECLNATNKDDRVLLSGEEYDILNSRVISANAEADRYMKWWRELRSNIYAPILDRFSNKDWASIDCGDGWRHIILSLNEQLAAIDPNYEVHQVKEKFGGLRYYCSFDGDPIARTLIEAAESLSYKTCETCGQPGTTRDGGWVVTLCDKHDAARSES